MVNKVGLILMFCLLFTFTGNSQCNFSNNSFQANEYVSYELYYNWGFLWLSAGQASFNVSNYKFNNQPAYLLKSEGSTYSNYDWFYKVRDTFESVINPKNVTPYLFTRDTYEGGYKVDNHYKFNYNENNIISKTENNKKGLKIDTLKNSTCTFDILSAIYACRTINFSNYIKNDTIPLTMIIDGEIFHLYLRYLGEENIVNRDYRKFNCNKFSLMLVEGTVFSGGEDMYIWVTNDKNQIPVLIEAKIIVGSAKAMVNEIKGTKWPANYHIYNTDN